MRDLLKSIAREPLTHFVILALLMFVVSRWWDTSGNGTGASDAERFRIVITPDQSRRLAEGYFRQYGVLPTETQRHALIDNYVREEVLYREGLLLGLDRDDEIVRRRIAQKVEFLEQDLDFSIKPTDVQLEAYYREHQDRYTVPAKRTFTHVYFSPDAAGDERARQRALEVLKKLEITNVRRASEWGDVFGGLSDYSALGAVEVSRVFGKSEFSRSLFTAPLHQWSGPYRSGFGWHLVFVEDQEPARVAPLADVLDAARADFVAEAQERRNAAAFAKLRSKYTVVRQGETRAPAG